MNRNCLHFCPYEVMMWQELTWREKGQALHTKHFMSCFISSEAKSTQKWRWCEAPPMSMRHDQPLSLSHLLWHMLRALIPCPYATHLFSSLVPFFADNTGLQFLTWFAPMFVSVNPSSLGLRLLALGLCWNWKPLHHPIDEVVLDELSKKKEGKHKRQVVCNGWREASI